MKNDELEYDYNSAYLEYNGAQDVHELWVGLHGLNEEVCVAEFVDPNHARLFLAVLFEQGQEAPI